MPTTNFIYEAAIDRHYETGEDPPPREPPQFPCEICGETKASGFDLARHLGEAHPLHPPRLLLDGRVVVGQQTLRQFPDPGSLAVAGATEVAVREPNGGERIITLDELAPTLASSNEQTYVIVLRHRRSADGAVAEEEVRLHVDVPSRADLDAADAAFTDQMCGEAIMAADLRRFDEQTNQLATGRTYVGALYRYGLFVQLRSAVTASPADVVASKENAQTSFEVLRHYPDRPLPRAVAGLIRFTLNDLFPWTPTGVPDLDSCARALSELAGAQTPPALKTDLKVETVACPVDTTTKIILESWSKGLDGRLQLEMIATNRAATVDDQGKAGVLALALLPSDVPIPAGLGVVAKRLQHDPLFGPWVENQIESRARVQ